jgi:drug/metabolite transporter (DMT)-like permease
MSASSPLPAKASFIMLLLCACWGLNMVAMKLGVEGIPPALQGALRSIGGAVLGLAWCLLRGVRLSRILHDGTLWPGLAAGLIFGVEFGCFYLGVALTTASRAVLMVYTAPFFVLLLSRWFLPGEALGPRVLLGLGIAFLGLVLSMAEGLLRPAGPYAIWGDLLCLMGGLGWAATTVLIKASRLRQASPEATMLYQLVVSIPVLLGFSWLLGEPPMAPTPLVWAGLAYQTVAVAFISYIAWFWLVQRHSAARLSAFTFITPIFGVLAGWLVLGDPLGPLFLAALLLVCAGIWIVQRR